MLTEWWNIAAWMLTAGLATPAAVFSAQCLAALLKRRPPRRKVLTDPAMSPARPRVAVLTPAHDEEYTLGATLDALGPQLRADDIALVVADNCTDRTADVARRREFVETVERTDHSKRAKGYALAYGLEALKPRPFDVLVMLDADCRLAPGSLDALAAQAAASGKVAQAVYLMEPCPAPTPRDRVSAFAFVVKNLVRPMGLDRLGLPVPMTGNGMAIPRAALDQIALGNGNIVEDMQLGLDMALAGYAPRLCPEARVTGQFPRESGAAMAQRRRWEHGHLRTILRQLPRLLALGLARARFSAWAMAVDLIVPPLSLLLVMLLISSAAAGIGALTLGLTWLPTVILLGSFAAVLGSVLLVWRRFGRESLPASSFGAVLGYVLWKLPMYGRFFVKPEKEWIRTEREAEDVPDSAKTAA
jgi:cellulose synthase/poly-beta-1,6-N-acetylglucosamine synthase-like glycosyltransferase